MSDFERIQETIGYNFEDKRLLENALTHSSYTAENDKSYRHNNERLEFIGDAFLDAIVGIKLFDIMPDATEGVLSKKRAHIVCERSLAELARSIKLGDSLLLGKGEELTGGRNKDSILADALEALIGAIVIDGGYDAARIVANDIFAEYTMLAIKNKLCKDYKTELQEWLQDKYKSVAIRYVPVSESGPDHEKSFTVAVEAAGKRLGEGTGKSKKEAEQNAAKAVISKEEI